MRGDFMIVNLGPILAIVAGVLILPQLLNLIVGIYLIVYGVLELARTLR